MSGFSYGGDHSVEIQFVSQLSQKLVQFKRLFFQVELDTLVHQIGIIRLLQVVNKDVMRVATWGMLDHDLHRIIEFLIVTMQVNNFIPKLILSANSDQLADIQFLEESLDEIEEFLLFVFRVQTCQRGEDSDMGLPVSHGLFQKLDDFVTFFMEFIESYHFFEVIWNQNYLHSCGLGQFEFFHFHTSEHDFFPCFHVVGFLCVFNSLLILS